MSSTAGGRHSHGGGEGRRRARTNGERRRHSAGPERAGKRMGMYERQMLWKKYADEKVLYAMQSFVEPVSASTDQNVCCLATAITAAAA